jgi:uncharacterized protein YcaQ
MSESLNTRQVRRLALVRAGLLKPERTGLPDRVAGRGQRARQRCHSIIDRFGYLQLDTVAIAGARTHSIVLASRLRSFHADLTESLLAPGEPLFEYWGHEACWLPLSLYPAFAFRRKAYRVHPWWGDVLAEHKVLAREIVHRLENEGALRSIDFEGKRSEHVWASKITTRVAEALWSAGDIAVKARVRFQRVFDLTERVIPDFVRELKMTDEASLDLLLLKALAGHGWATTGTLSATWRLRNQRSAIIASLQRLAESGQIVACSMRTKEREFAGWVRTADLEQVSELDALRPRADKGVLLSPFDPVLWDRARTQTLFDFELLLEIYKPANERRFGYYCLPVLAGEHLVARVDLKADRKLGRLEVLSCHLEQRAALHTQVKRARAAIQSAMSRFADAVALSLDTEALGGL